MFLWIDNLFGAFRRDVSRAYRFLSRCHNALFRFDPNIVHVSLEMCFLLTYEMILSQPVLQLYWWRFGIEMLFEFHSCCLEIDVLLSFRGWFVMFVFVYLSSSYACQAVWLQVCPMVNIWYFLARERSRECSVVIILSRAECSLHLRSFFFKECGVLIDVLALKQLYRI